MGGRGICEAGIGSHKSLFREVGVCYGSLMFHGKQAGAMMSLVMLCSVQHSFELRQTWFGWGPLAN